MVNDAVRPGEEQWRVANEEHDNATLERNRWS
jgi:hypothetical protein